MYEAYHRLAKSIPASVTSVDKGIEAEVSAGLARDLAWQLIPWKENTKSILAVRLRAAEKRDANTSRLVVAEQNIHLARSRQETYRRTRRRHP